MRFVTLTLAPSLDASTQTARIMPEHKMRCTTEHLDCGGGGINISRNLMVLDEDTIAIAPLGGPDGAIFTDLARAENLELVAIETAGHTRRNLTVKQATDENEYRFTFPPTPLTTEECRSILTALQDQCKSGDALILSGSAPDMDSRYFWAELQQIVTDKQLFFAADSHDQVLRQALDAGARLIKPSSREMQDLTGTRLDNDLACLRAARSLLDQYPALQIIAISMGADGAMAITRHEAVRAQGPAIVPVSAVGAGDAFTASLVAHHLAGSSLSDSLGAACAQGTAVLTTAGTQPPPRAKVDSFKTQITLHSV